MQRESFQLSGEAVGRKVMRLGKEQPGGFDAMAEQGGRSRGPVPSDPFYVSLPASCDQIVTWCTDATGRDTMKESEPAIREVQQ